MTLYVPPSEGILIGAAPGAAPVQLDSLNLDFVTQRPQANWCWAACAVMIGTHLKTHDPDLGSPPTMCHLAGIAHDNPNCCADHTQCDAGAWPDKVYEHLGINFNPDVPSAPTNSETVLTPSQIKEEITKNRRPVEVMYKWTTHGAHVVLITGVYSDGQLEVLDPWFGIEKPVSYDYVRSARGLGRWAGTYYGFVPAAVATAGSHATSGA